jgi:FkbM family methyltransferase
MKHIFDIDEMLNSGMSGKSILAENNERIKYVYGAGSAFHWVYEILIRNYAFSISGIIDDKFDFMCDIDGINCLNFDSFIAQKNDADCLIIVTISNDEVFNFVKNKFHSYGYFNVIHLRDIYEINDPFNTINDIDFNDCKHSIAAAYNLLADDKSKKLYSSILKTHVWKVPQRLEFDNEGHQYFDAQISKNIDSRYISICGCGVHDLKNTLNNCRGIVQRVDCFEPDPWNYYGDETYQGLLEFLDTSNKSDRLKVAAYHLAVSSKTSVGLFKSANDDPGSRSSNTTFGSKLSVAGKKIIQIISLDDFYGLNSPSYIIVDAEGSELDILKGAEKIIRNNRPSLAIAVYHKIQDIWELPLLIDSYGSNYSFYLRNYTGYASETILYGVIKK